MNADGRIRFINQSNRASAKMSDLQFFPAEKWKVNVILRKESRNMSSECKTPFVSVWDAVMKLQWVNIILAMI